VSDLPRDLRRDLHRVLADLRVAHLAGTAWPVVAGDLGRLDKAVAQGHAEAIGKALVPIAQAGSEGKVRGRLAGADRAAAYVGSSRPSVTLPLVGAVVGAALVGAAYLLGGGWVAGGAAVLVAAVAGVLYTGSRGRAGHLERRHAQAFSPTKERTEPAPRVVLQAIDEIEAALTTEP
jgi:hypothetical protein